MIIICEPQCKGISHEKFNSGFIYGLRLAFPAEKILFFSHASHIQAIQKILIQDGTAVKNIEYVPIRYGDPFSLTGIPRYYRVLHRLFSAALKNGSDKVFFLSYSPLILYLIKKLKQKSKFLSMKFTFVLHGGFENIVPPADKVGRISLREKKINDVSGAEKMSEISFYELASKLTKKIKLFFAKPLQSASANIFEEKKMLLWQHSNDFRYIALGPHVRENAKKYIDVDNLNMHTIVLPTTFEAMNPQPKNDHIKFGIFGYGNSLMLYNIAVLLSERAIKNNYEIRIIGMDNRGIASFPNITCPGAGRVLDRTEMKKYAEDIDVFLILYDKDRYLVTCSGSIMESLSHSKPILHFNNDCINAFNTIQDPIGFRCDSLNEFADKMESMIENYKDYVPQLEKFRKNISNVRNKYSIENSVNNFKNSFIW